MSFEPKILVLATVACAYPGADAVGKAHLEYPANVNVFRVPSPVIFPEDFYLRSFTQGIDGIIVAGCGSDCPYRDAYPKLANRLDSLVRRMKAGGLETDRMRLTTICTVCIKAFLKEVNTMNDTLHAIGPVDRTLAASLWKAAQQDLRVSNSRLSEPASRQVYA